MKKNILTFIGMLGLGVSVTHAQVLLESWENNHDGWSIIANQTTGGGGIWTDDGFSTSYATQGTYSWELVAKITSSGPNYGPTLQGPSTTAMTLLMANASSVSMDIAVPECGDFGWDMQWDLEINQPGGARTISVDGFSYPGDAAICGSTTMTWPVSQAARTALDAYPSLPTYLTFSIGGGSSGGNSTAYIDNIEVIKYLKSKQRCPFVNCGTTSPPIRIRRRPA